MRIDVVEGSALSLRLRLQGFPVKVLDKVKVAVATSAVDLQGQIKEKLSGPVLKNRTGRLRNSISMNMTEDDQSVSAVVGTNVVYARVHEFGFQGEVSVREHMRTAAPSLRGQAESQSQSLRSQVMVRAHTMRMNMPERSFMRSTLAENAPAIADRISAAILQSVQE